jgi:hypothetical protein
MHVKICFDNMKITFASNSKPDASILTPSIARQQVNPCFGSILFSFAHENTQRGPEKDTRRSLYKIITLVNKFFDMSYATPSSWKFLTYWKF